MPAAECAPVFAIGLAANRPSSRSEIERRVIPSSLKRLWAALCVVAPIGFLFPSGFRDEVIMRRLQVLPKLALTAPASF
jgi:hypothetical protein